MPRRDPYPLRSGDRKQYRETDSQEEDEDEEVEDSEDESSGSLQQQRQKNTSNRSSPDRSQGNNSSLLSSTASDSFSFHSGQSPTAKNRLYPDLPPPSPSPKSTRKRDIPCLTPESAWSDKSQNNNRSVVSESSGQKIETTDGGISLSLTQIISILGIVVLLAALIYSRFVTPDPDVLQARPNHFLVFSEKLDRLHAKFPEQNARFWRIIKASAKQVLDSDGQSAYPAVLLMVAERTLTASTASLAAAVTLAFESSLTGRPESSATATLNLTSIAGRMDADSQKLELDRWLRGELDGSRSAVTVHHLELLQPEAALLLYAYCDGDSAPYKNALLVWGLFLDQGATSSRSVEEALKGLWIPKLSEDKVGALLSRVANNVALVAA